MESIFRRGMFRTVASAVVLVIAADSVAACGSRDLGSTSESQAGSEGSSETTDASTTGGLDQCPATAPEADPVGWQQCDGMMELPPAGPPAMTTCELPLETSVKAALVHQASVSVEDGFGPAACVVSNVNYEECDTSVEMCCEGDGVVSTHTIRVTASPMLPVGLRVGDDVVLTRWGQEDPFCCLWTATTVERDGVLEVAHVELTDQQDQWDEKAVLSQVSAWQWSFASPVCEDADAGLQRQSIRFGEDADSLVVADDAWDESAEGARAIVQHARRFEPKDGAPSTDFLTLLYSASR